MLRINLSTRPFYNERAVHLGLAVLAVVGLLLVGTHGRRLVALSATYTELVRQATTDEAAAAALDRQSETLERTIERRRLEAVAAEARQANVLIDRRTFSWTEFFNVIEATLPPDVMLSSVRPQFTEGSVEVAMTVVSKGTAELGAFMDELEKTGAFADLLVRQEEVADRGLHRAVLNGRYLGPPGAAGATRPGPARAGNDRGRAEGS